MKTSDMGLLRIGDALVDRALGYPETERGAAEFVDAARRG
jgi:hypothetical protein